MRTGEMANDTGSMIYGQEAVEVGLVDSLGGLSDALELSHHEIGKQRKRRNARRKNVVEGR